MVTEDLIDLPGLLTKNIEANDDIEPGEVNVDDTVEKLHRETFSILNTDLCGDLVSDTSDVNMEVDPPEPLRLLDKNNVVGVGLTSENGSLSLARKNDAPEDAACTISLATPSRKRARMEHDADQPSVHVTYKSLRSSSRQKLEELLKQWSNWHAQHCSSSPDTSEEVYSGEKTFFPALQVGVEKPSAVLFWIDQQTMRTENEGVISFDSKTVPLYDRGYSLGLNTEDYSNNLEGGLEIMDKAARCFNCGSYSHSLKECPKPRDNVTVNNAREQHRSKRNQNAAIRSTTRYYQDTPAGKFNGLKPGTLDSETQKLLGLGELDPPPWLNRMRELGYPPGYLAGCLAHAIVGTKTKAANSVVRAAIRARCHYVNKKWLGGMLTNWSTTETRLHKFRDSSKEALFICLLTYAEVDVDNQPSGIIMFADEEAKADDMDGWIAETRMEPPKKKLVKFPGINAPIPENADEGRWADLPLRSKTSSRQSHDRTSHPSLPINIPYVQDHRLSRYMRDDPPPGTESVFSPLPFHNSVENSSQLSRSLDSYERSRMSHYEDYSSRSYYSFRGYASPGRGGQYSPSHHDRRYGQSMEVGRHYYDRDYPREDWHGSIHRHHRDRDYPSDGGIRYGHHSWR